MPDRPDPVAAVAARVGPLVDSNVHLWDQRTNPVFWLSDRTLVRDMLGNYESLPDTYTVADHCHATGDFDVDGIVWSDAGAADPAAAARWVGGQSPDGPVLGLVSLADVADPGFETLVRTLATIPRVTSVRVRFVPGLAGAAASSAADGALVDRLALLGDLGLVATIEAPAERIGLVADVAHRLPTLPIVLDHFGWPSDLTAAGRRAHLDALRRVAEAPNVSTRIDAIGTIFGDWDTATIGPWLQGAVEAFGADRCMLGSDLPIETLRSTFGRLYAAYDTIFDTCSDEERRQLFGAAARRIYGA